MPRVTLTLEDDPDEQDAIQFKVQFDPPIDDDTEPTAAQSEAAFLLEVMQRRASGQTLEQIAAEMSDDQYGRDAGGYEPGGLTLTDCMYTGCTPENRDPECPVHGAQKGNN